MVRIDWSRTGGWRPIRHSVSPLEVVAKAGADAFALRDLGRADAALKFSARLADYKQMSQELLEYYRRKR